MFKTKAFWRVLSILSVTLVVVISLLSLRLTSKPYGIIFASISILLLFLMYSIYKVTNSFSGINFVCLNVAFVFLFLSCFEVYLINKTPNKPSKHAYSSRTPNYVIKHDFLGVSATKNTTARHIKGLDGKVFFEATYTFDENGLRITPFVSDPENIYLFFGGSFTFGEGVDDHETMPYVFQKLKGPDSKTYNFGFHGYGTQQMLSWIESDRLKAILPNNNVKAVVYQAILGHINRAKGLNHPWSTGSIRYVMTTYGKVVPEGKLTNPQSAAKKSKLITKILNRNTKVLNKDMDFFVAMLKKAKSDLHNQYNCDFLLLLWKYGYLKYSSEKAWNFLLSRLDEEGIKYYVVESDILNNMDFSKIAIDPKG